LKLRLREEDVEVKDVEVEEMEVDVIEVPPTLPPPPPTPPLMPRPPPMPPPSMPLPPPLPPLSMPLPSSMTSQPSENLTNRDPIKNLRSRNLVAVPEETESRYTDHEVSPKSKEGSANAVNLADCYLLYFLTFPFFSLLRLINFPHSFFPPN